MQTHEPRETLDPCFVIGVAGGTGSGKTTVAEAITAAFPAEECVYLDFDAYYRDLAHMPPAERAKVNFDAPDALETELLCEQIDTLRRGESVEKPIYDFANHVRSEQSVEIPAARLIIVEGIHVLSVKDVRDRLDVRIFVDTAADIRLLRRIRRDIDERGRTLEDVEAQYLASVRPMHDTYVEPSRAYADLVIPEGGKNELAVGMLIEAIRSLSVVIDRA